MFVIDFKSSLAILWLDLLTKNKKTFNMGYKDLFYVAGNIIGYTGTIQSNPTVYFQNGASFGHITQNHKIKENIGREEVFWRPNYSITNELIKNRPTCVERIGSQVIHESRNKFISVHAMSSLHKNILKRSILNFTQMKALNSSLSTDEYKRIVNRAKIPGLDVQKLIRRHELYIRLSKSSN